MIISTIHNLFLINLKVMIALINDYDDRSSTKTCLCSHRNYSKLHLAPLYCNLGYARNSCFPNHYQAFMVSSPSGAGGGGLINFLPGVGWIYSVVTVLHFQQKILSSSIFWCSKLSKVMPNEIQLTNWYQTDNSTYRDCTTITKRPSIYSSNEQLLMTDSKQFKYYSIF